MLRLEDTSRKDSGDNFFYCFAKKYTSMSEEKIHIKKPTLIKAEGYKIIEEFIGNMNTQTSGISIARMKSPPGWEEPPQQPEFDEKLLTLYRRKKNPGLIFVRLK